MMKEEELIQKMEVELVVVDQKMEAELVAEDQRVKGEELIQQKVAELVAEDQKMEVGLKELEVHLMQLLLMEPVLTHSLAELERIHRTKGLAQQSSFELAVFQVVEACNLHQPHRDFQPSESQ